MFPHCAPNMTSRQSSANGSSVARRPIAADGRFMSSGSCPSNARTSARTSVSRRTRAMDAPSQPGARIAMTQANAPRGAAAGQQQAASQQGNARRRARFKKPGRNADKSLPQHKKLLFPVLPMSRPIGRNVWRGHTGISSKKTGARRETRKTARGAATRRKSVPMVLARRKSLGPGPAGAADPEKGALAANRDAPCALSAAA